MDSYRWEVNCQRCGKVLDVGLFTRQRSYCTLCEIELQDEPLHTPEDKMPTPSDMPDVPLPFRGETTLERSQRHAQEDHDYYMDLPDRYPG